VRAIRDDGRVVEFARYATRAQALACLAKMIAYGMQAELADEHLAPEGEP
jgi:hypothetical protein